MKRPVKIEHLINWYYSNLAYKYENCDVDVYHKIKRIASKLKVDKLAHKKFAMIMKENLVFNGIKRKPCDCEICKRLGVGK